jgi:hypothetical protein
MELKRRDFLKASSLGAGSLLLTQFVNQLHAAPKTRPARVLFFVQGNGVYPRDIQPQGIERLKTPSKLEDRSLDGHAMSLAMEPLAPWAKKMTMIHGLSGRIARGSHNMGFAALGCWPMKKKAYGETIDAALARILGGIYPHIGLGVSNKAMSMTYNLTSVARGKALPTLLNPVQAHERFFAAGAAGDARKNFDVNTNLLDFLADDVKRLQKQLDGYEREKLGRYLDAFESMSQRQGQLAAMARQIAAAAPKIDPKTGQIVETKLGPTGVFDRLEAQFENAAGAMIAGLTNVVTVSGGAGPDRIGLSCMASELGKNGADGYIGAHAIGHGNYQHFAGISGPECHALIRRTCLEQLAKFIRRLESVPEGDGTMMDNTLIVYLSDSAEGHHPVCQEWPFILIGDLGGRLKLGNRYMRYPWYGNNGHRTIANLYLSLLHSVGEERKTFGVADFGLGDLDQTGPLAEIMV